MDMKFGDYCFIEQRRDGEDNKFSKYKVIGTSRANWYRPVPVTPHQDPEYFRCEMCDVVRVIRCGTREDTVDTFRIKDVSPDKEETS